MVSKHGGPSYEAPHEASLVWDLQAPVICLCVVVYLVHTMGFLCVVLPFEIP